MTAAKPAVAQPHHAHLDSGCGHDILLGDDAYGSDPLSPRVTEPNDE